MTPGVAEPIAGGSESLKVAASSLAVTDPLGKSDSRPTLMIRLGEGTVAQAARPSARIKPKNVKRILPHLDREGIAATSALDAHPNSYGELAQGTKRELAPITHTWVENVISPEKLRPIYLCPFGRSIRRTLR